ncbi:TIGR01906 family membrane protein [Streptococcus loxodontisalivarius]|uniref:Integral membrane protein (TIGR01906 family) n=1 Tax=Streptococcus loxodontisalivarius TaxID=1349415 RepID=A0ABS2PQV0_9STRE|nr:TIGR01906 family membrane protein [Streptococcus loxodontisalivarius]MBM7642419.1 integral membrane protein (TIGR01906 family) [Streptococcus loxodontisalivarius]
MTKLRLPALLLWLLSFSVLATIYLAWLIYPLEISWLGLEKVVYLSSKTISYNFNQLMQFLTIPWVSELKMADFPTSDSGLGHFVDVKHLFVFCQLVFLVLLYPSLVCLRQLFQKKGLWLHQKAFLLAAVLPLVIAVMAALIGFDAFFTLFHQVLFPGNSSWLFNPYTDPVIYILPEDYFLHCFLIFFVIYELLFFGLYGLGKWQWRKRQ